MKKFLKFLPGYVPAGGGVTGGRGDHKGALPGTRYQGKAVAGG